MRRSPLVALLAALVVALLGLSAAAAQKGTEEAAEGSQTSGSAEGSQTREESREEKRVRRQLERLEKQQQELEEEMRERLRQLEELEQAQREAAAEAAEEAKEAASSVAREGRERADRWRRARPVSAQAEDQKFAIGGTARVRAGEVASEVFALGGKVEIDGEVDGGAVALLGPVIVNGKVRGDVVSIGSDVRLGPTAVVTGDVTSVGGEVERSPGAQVEGEISEAALGVDLGDLDLFSGAPDLSRLSRRGLSSLDEWFGFFWALVVAGCYVILCGLMAVIAPRAVDNVRRTVSRDTWKCALLGLAIGLLVIPATVVIVFLLVVSIIGIPFLILVPFVYLFLVLAGLFGLAGTAMAAGRVVRDRFGLGVGGGLLSMVVGLVALRGLMLLSDLFDALGMPWMVHGMFGICGFLVWFAACCVAMGAVFLSRMGQAGPPELPPLPVG
ncbi:MAG: polymer-forming cytoskeletal protein [Acidobacteria bacterium]|nr:MAG: polymer-forming cytoskeletal protein [Acidobacteriota bacterium]REK11012.1 MAG: polymer-forming cytoskeletal protein [Acidobacteriota bacterium]